MITNGQSTSLLIPSQLPGFIRDDPDYAKFVAFLQAYYEWMEQEGNVLDSSNNLLNYNNIDNTSAEFIDYFTNQFLPYFPKDALISPEKAIKVARQLYQAKGTPSSYKFLFRILYNSDFDYFYTGDSVLKASDGNWYVAKSLKLATTDNNFLNIANYRLFGETSQSIATVENAVKVGTKTEVFISNIERLFQSGETVRVVDNANQTVLFNGQPLTAKVVGQISQVNIDPNNRGLLYQVGDPVIIYNGLNSNTANPVGATAQVGSTTTGSITNIATVTSGFGYTQSPNTVIDITNAPGAVATVAGLNPANNTISPVTLPIDTIGLKHTISIGAAAYHFANDSTANANTTLQQALSFTSFLTYPITSVLVTNGGGGITQTPTVRAISEYQTDANTYVDLKSLGMLGPIQIANGGVGYQANDKIVFTGGSGTGAYANVLSVNASGGIQTVGYVYGPHPYFLGGTNYTNATLPTLSVQSANTHAANASLYVPGILGDGATFSTVVNRAGSITTINLINPGEDYVSTPNVSLVVHDIVVTNVNIYNLPQKGDKLYQGANANAAIYTSTFDSINLLTPNLNPANSTYVLRAFNYNSNPNPSLPLYVNGKPIVDILMANSRPSTSNTTYNNLYNVNGIRAYGDAAARATASFLNGLVLSQGQYLNTKGQLSSYSVMQSDIYNNFTYEITVEKEIAKYRDILLNLLHPAGLKVIGRNKMEANLQFSRFSTTAIQQGLALSDYTGYLGSTASMYTDFNTISTNQVTLTNLAGADVTQFIFTGVEGVSNSIIQITPTNGPNVRSEVIGISFSSQAPEDLRTESGTEDLSVELGSTDLMFGIPTLTLRENTWLTFPNVAYAYANTNTNQINITSLTGSFDITNNRNYSNIANPLLDIVFAGDVVQLNGTDNYTVSNVDYNDGIIYTNGNIISNVTNSLLSVNRTFNATDGQVKIYGAIGIQYFPELTTEDGTILTDEQGNIIILG
jgi:hypothetical protein